MQDKVIEGLKLHVPGSEVKELLEKKAAHHRKRAGEYRQTYDTLVAALGPITEEDASKHSSNARDSRTEHREGMERHTNIAIEDEFLAAHIVVTQAYLLETSDLHRLGVLKNRY